MCALAVRHPSAKFENLKLTIELAVQIINIFAVDYFFTCLFTNWTLDIVFFVYVAGI